MEIVPDALYYTGNILEIEVLNAHKIYAMHDHIAQMVDSDAAKEFYRMIKELPIERFVISEFIRIMRYFSDGWKWEECLLDSVEIREIGPLKGMSPQMYEMIVRKSAVKRIEEKNPTYTQS